MKPTQISIHELEAHRVYECTGLRIEPLPQKRTRWEQRLISTWASGMKGEWSQERGICKGCACEIDNSPTPMSYGGETVLLPSTVCEDCMEVVRAHYDPARPALDEQSATETPKWDANCPERHKQVAAGESRPDRIDWDAFERVKLWTPADRRGLVLVGQPGTGKSSAFWALARELERGGHQPLTIGSVELGRVLANAAKDIREVGWLYRCRVLMVDDLGKERASPGVASLLWEVLDRRLSANLPAIFTTQFDGASLARRFGEDHLGDSIRRRIGDLCRVVTFLTAAEKAKARAAADAAKAA